MIMTRRATAAARKSSGKANNKAIIIVDECDSSNGIHLSFNVNEKKNNKKNNNNKIGQASHTCSSIVNTTCWISPRNLSSSHWARMLASPACTDSIRRETRRTNLHISKQETGNKQDILIVLRVPRFQLIVKVEEVQTVNEQ